MQIRNLLFDVVAVFMSFPAFALYTPQAALKDAMSEPLRLVGKYIPESSESGKYPTCLFRNSKVLVESNYCVSENVPAARLIIHPVDPSRGYVRLYAEIETLAKDISIAKRAEYVDFLFSVSARITSQKFSVDMTAAEYAAWESRETQKYSHYCVTGLRFKDQPNSTVCADLEGQVETWGSYANKFWQKSDPKFAALLKRIKVMAREKQL